MYASLRKITFSSILFFELWNYTSQIPTMKYAAVLFYCFAEARVKGRMYICAVRCMCVCACVCGFIRFGFTCNIIHSVFRGSDCSKSTAQKTSPPSRKNPPLLNYPFNSKWPVCSSFPLCLLWPDS